MIEEAAALQVCNDALALIGHSVTIKTLDKIDTAEARSCSRALPSCLLQCLDKGQWSFARRDEVINDDYLTDFSSYPWQFTYKLPDDVSAVYSLTDLAALSLINTAGYDASYIRFDLRNIDNQRYLVTDAAAPFVIHYQANDISLGVCSALFVQALTYMLASKLAPEFVKSQIGFEMGLRYLEISYQLLELAAANDSQQGAYSQRSVKQPSMIKARS